MWKIAWTNNLKIDWLISGYVTFAVFKTSNNGVARLTVTKKMISFQLAMYAVKTWSVFWPPRTCRWMETTGTRADRPSPVTAHLPRSQDRVDESVMSWVQSPTLIIYNFFLRFYLLNFIFGFLFCLLCLVILWIVK